MPKPFVRPGELAAMAAEGRADPAGFRRRLALWALLGRALFAWPLACCLLAALVLWNSEFNLSFIFLALAALLAAINAEVWRIRFALRREECRKGTRLTREQAPSLYESLERLGSCGSPVVLDASFSAQLEELPRGSFPWTNELQLRIGLPLLETLDEEGARTILAVLAYYERQAGPLSGWIDSAHARFEFERDKNVGQMLIPRFLWDWYLPRFDLRVRALARLKSEEADAAAAGAASAGAFGRALASLVVRGRRIEHEARPAIERAALASELDEPETARLLAEHARAPRAEDARDFAAVLAETDDDDHYLPALKTRLTRLGVDPAAVTPVEAPARSAADALWGESLSSMRGLVDAGWRREQGDDWSAAREKFKNKMRRFEELRAGPAGAGSFLESIEELRLAAEFEGVEGASRSAERLLMKFPESATARCHMGSILALASDSRCLEHLRFVLDRPSIYAEYACRALLTFAERTGETELARECKEKLDLLKEKTADAWARRGQLTAEDEFEPHGLAPADIAALSRMIADAPGLKRAFVCRKKVRDFSSDPHFIVLFEGDLSVLILKQKIWSAWFDGFSEKLSFEKGSVVVTETNAAGPDAAAGIKAAPGSLIYERAAGDPRERFFDSAVHAARWLLIAAIACFCVFITRAVLAEPYGVMTPLLGLNPALGFCALHIYDQRRFNWAPFAALAVIAGIAFWAAWRHGSSWMVVMAALALVIALSGMSWVRSRRSY